MAQVESARTRSVANLGWCSKLKSCLEIDLPSACFVRNLWRFASSHNMKYRGRKPSNNIVSCCPEWRHEYTKYRRWNGSSWVTVTSYSAGSWQESGTPGLSYFNLNTDVTLEGGALVKQRLKYRLFFVELNQHQEWSGSIHSHFLE